MDELERAAKELLAPEVYDFFAGGSGREETLAENLRGWSRVRLRPRVLRDVSGVELSTTLFDTTFATPVALAPVGYLGLAHPLGEVALAEGARRAGCLFVLSSRSGTPVGEVAAAAGGAPWWLQVYVLTDRARTAALVDEAVALGCGALVLTGDTPVVARKPRERLHGFAMPEQFRLAGDDEGARQDPATTFADIGWLAERCGLPVLVKGVLRGDDARRCIESGASGVVVSNHGGRQLDGAVSTAEALGEVVDALSGSATVLVDGGVRSGVDVLRALGLGAKAVLLGRPAVWALATEGAAGVARLVGRLGEDLVEAMQLAGTADVESLRSGAVVLP